VKSFFLPTTDLLA
jgi:hypothetical protein